MLVGLEEDNPCAGCHRLPADALLLYFLIFFGAASFGNPGCWCLGSFSNELLLHNDVCESVL